MHEVFYVLDEFVYDLLHTDRFNVLIRCVLSSICHVIFSLHLDNASIDCLI